MESDGTAFAAELKNLNFSLWSVEMSKARGRGRVGSGTELGSEVQTYGRAGAGRGWQAGEEEQRVQETSTEWGEEKGDGARCFHIISGRFVIKQIFTEQLQHAKRCFGHRR